MWNKDEMKGKADTRTSTGLRLAAAFALTASVSVDVGVVCLELGRVAERRFIARRLARRSSRRLTS